MQNPKVWEDHEKASLLGKELSNAQDEVKEVQDLRATVSDIKELEQLAVQEEELESQVEALEKTIANLEKKAFLSGPHDKEGATLTITAGAGGRDAQDWAAMLLRMYERYCEKKRWKVTRIHESFGESGAEGRTGIKQAVIDIEGPYAYGLLKNETGVHRLVRISPFSSQSLRHTSFASADVVPLLKSKDVKEIQIRPDDLKVEFTRSSGPGGQNVNKRETAVRVTHIPTGIVVSSQNSRTQQKNREKAIDLLVSRLAFIEEQKRQQELAIQKEGQAAIEWGSQIRSYVLHPYKMVKDHRTGVETSRAEQVLEGDLELCTETARTHD